MCAVSGHRGSSRTCGARRGCGISTKIHHPGENAQRPKKIGEANRQTGQTEENPEKDGDEDEKRLREDARRSRKSRRKSEGEGKDDAA